MKRNTYIILFVLILTVFLSNPILAKKLTLRSAGIGCRGSYWRMNDTPTELKVVSNWDRTVVDVGGGGGWLYFLSRMNERWLAEFSLGAVGEVEVTENHFDGEDVAGSVITPILFGARYELFSATNTNAFKPYLNFGGGPYWFHDYRAKSDYYDEAEVTVNTKLKSGAYAGGGVNFMLTSWLGINFDMRYHFINLNVKHPRSGFEYGLGLNVMWGNFQAR